MGKRQLFELGKSDLALRSWKAVYKQRLRYLLTISVVLLTGGCQFEGRYIYSDPKIASGEDIRVENGRISLPEVEIWILSRNRKGQGAMVFPVPMPMSPGDDCTKPFQMIVAITPKRDGFLFDPGKLFLWENAGKKNVPKRIKSGAYLKVNELLDRIPPTVVKEIPLRKNITTTITLEFDILPPDPGETFFVDLAGLSLLGQAYKVRRLRFEKDTFAGPLRRG